MRKVSFILVALSFVLLGCVSSGERFFISEKKPDRITFNLGNIMIGRDGSVYSDPVADKYCKSLGFDGFKDIKYYNDNAGVLGGHYELTYYCKKDLKKKNKVKVNQTKDEANNLDKFKNQCASLGFKKGTEKFADCVLELSK